MGDRSVRIFEQPPIGKTVRRHIDDAHDPGAGEIEPGQRRAGLREALKSVEFVRVERHRRVHRQHLGRGVPAQNLDRRETEQPTGERPGTRLPGWAWHGPQINTPGVVRHGRGIAQGLARRNWEYSPH